MVNMPKKKYLMRRFNSVVSSIVILITCFSSIGVGAKMSNVELIFNKMELQGIDVSQELLYGYFFLSKSKTSLVSIQKILLQQHYTFVELHKAENSVFVLHVEKIEKHTRKSLMQRDEELEKLVLRFSDIEYDGWDVGNVDSKKPLITTDEFLNFVSKKTDSELFDYATKLYENEIYDRALQVFDICIGKNIKADVAQYKAAFCLISLGKTDEGIKRYKEVILINPSYYLAYFNIAAISYDNHQFDESLQYYKKCVEMSPTDDKAFYGLAARQYALKQYDEAQKNSLMALKINSKNENAPALLEMLKERKR